MNDKTADKMVKGADGEMSEMDGRLSYEKPSVELLSLDVAVLGSSPSGLPEGASYFKF